MGLHGAGLGRAWRGRNRHWERDEDDEWSENDAATDDPDAYELGDFIDGEITLARWVDPAGEEALPIVSQVSPYTLILSKTEELFEREARERRSWQSDLAWLGRLGAGRRP